MDTVAIVAVALISSSISLIGALLTTWLQGRNERIRSQHEYERTIKQHEYDREQTKTSALWALEGELRLNATLLKEWRGLEPDALGIFESGAWLPFRTDAYEAARPYLAEIELTVSRNVWAATAALQQLQALEALSERLRDPGDYSYPGNVDPDYLSFMRSDVYATTSNRVKGLDEALLKAANELRTLLTGPQWVHGMEALRSVPADTAKPR